jgi:hypothetical protein
MLRQPSEGRSVEIAWLASGEVAKTNAQCAKRNPGAFGCSDYHRDESPSRRKRSRRQSRTRWGRLHCQSLWSEGTTRARPSRIAAAGNGTGRTNLRSQARRTQIRRWQLGRRARRLVDPSGAQALLSKGTREQATPESMKISSIGASMSRSCGCGVNWRRRLSCCRVEPF